MNLQTADGVERFKDDLERALLDHARTLSRPAVPAPARSPRPRRGAVSVMALVAVALLVTLLMNPDGGHPGGPSVADAAQVLRGAGDAALTGGPRALGPRQYWYTRVRFVPRQGAAVAVDERWQARDGSGRDIGPYAGGGDERVRASAHPFRFGTRSLSYRQLAALPTDPAGLSRVLERTARRQLRAGLAAGTPLLRGPAARTYAVFTVLRSAYESPAPPALRAALFDVMATLPGLTLEGEGIDHAGRHGTAISTVLGDVRFRVLIDAGTGDLLETQRILVRPSRQLGQAKPGVYSWATNLAAQPVDRVGDR